MQNKLILFLLLVFTCASTAYGQTADHKIHSEILDEEREYWISLPDSYDDETETYPLLIILDGQSLFQPLSSAFSFMSRSRRGSRRVPEMIVVGIRSTNRERDFTPDKIVTKRKNDTGGADQFLDFLENELMPELQSKYRTTSGNLLVGHSLGGLFAAHAYMKAESSFSGFIAIDPSFRTWDDAIMDQKIEAVTANSFNRFLYIASAYWGAHRVSNRNRHVRFYEALNRKNYQLDNTRQLRVKHEYFEDESHGSVPLIAFYNGLMAMFNADGLANFRE